MEIGPRNILQRMITVLFFIVSFWALIYQSSKLFEQFIQTGIPDIRYERSALTWLPGMSFCVPFPRYVKREFLAQVYKNGSPVLESKFDRHLLDVCIKLVDESDRPPFLDGSKAAHTVEACAEVFVTAIESLDVPFADVSKNMLQSGFLNFSGLALTHNEQEVWLSEDNLIPAPVQYFVKFHKCWGYLTQYVQARQVKLDYLQQIDFTIVIDYDALDSYGFNLKSHPKKLDIKFTLHDSRKLSDFNPDTTHSLNRGRFYSFTFQKTSISYMDGRNGISCYNYWQAAPGSNDTESSFVSEDLCLQYQQKQIIKDRCNRIDLNVSSLDEWLNDNRSLGTCKEQLLTEEDKKACPMDCDQYFYLMTVSDPGTPLEDRPQETEINVKPSYFPATLVTYSPKMTKVEFIAQMSGILGACFGISIFGLSQWLRENGLLTSLASHVWDWGIRLSESSWFGSKGKSLKNNLASVTQIPLNVPAAWKDSKSVPDPRSHGEATRGTRRKRGPWFVERALESEPRLPLSSPDQSNRYLSGIRSFTHSNRMTT